MTQIERLKQPKNSHTVSSTRSVQGTFRSSHAENAGFAPQQSIGNQASQRFSQFCSFRLPNPTICPFGGICHSCPARVQTKLKVGQPNDKYEQEADRVAEQIMRMPAPRNDQGLAVSRQTPGFFAHPTCTTCEEELLNRPLGEEEDKELFLQPKEASGYPPQPPLDLAGQIKGLTGKGQPLPKSECTFFEPRLGYGLGRVRFHTDAQAAKLTSTLNARAFTIGQHIVFGAGQYVPGVAAGRRLLAHELAHVIQQFENADIFKSTIQRDYVCGPDITAPLEAVLQDVENTFNSWTDDQGRRACNMLRGWTSEPWEAARAWDISDLYLPRTSWLRNPRYTQCGIPYHGAPATPEIEDRQRSPCGNSVRVGIKCALAGTVNYALFGKMCRLCNRRFGVLDVGEMGFLIGLWKTLDRDDPIPPGLWALAAFNGSLPPTHPVAENRAYCTGECPNDAAHTDFAWIWLPIRGGAGRGEIEGIELD